VPIGVGEELKERVAALVPILDRSGPDRAMGATQTTVEGDSVKTELELTRFVVDL
jgi:uncharacterized protein YqgV (UPF0045/DUF77 family)